MQCQRCGNTNPEYFYKGAKGYYCRRCIRFKRILVEEIISPKIYEVSDGSDEYALAYELTPAQKHASQELLQQLNLGHDVLLKCVCGAGKTEITVLSISEFLRAKKKVIYAISRREVVIELAKRFKTIFPYANVATICEGYNESDGDLIVCTTHQLYRFNKAVDLLILDEVDAYPFKGDEVLINIASNSLKEHGIIVYSTATVDETLETFMQKRGYVTVSLNKRPHGYPLIEPQVIYAPKILLYGMALCKAIKTKVPLIIFVETKAKAKQLGKIINHFIKTTYVYSDLKERNENIKAFKEGKYQVIVATSVLERGVTIKGVDVLIINLVHGIFDEASLVQMSGRVGRTFDCPTGHVWILSNGYKKEICHAFKTIRQANKMSLL